MIHGKNSIPGFDLRCPDLHHKDAVTPENQEKKLIIGLFDQNGIDGAVLTWAGDDLGAPDLRLNDRPFCEDIPPDVVWICGICLDILNGDLLGLAGFSVRDGCKFAAECTHFAVPSAGADDTEAGDADNRLSW
jgi:hypothetical protein